MSRTLLAILLVISLIVNGIVLYQRELVQDEISILKISHRIEFSSSESREKFFRDRWCVLKEEIDELHEKLKQFSSGFAAREVKLLLRIHELKMTLRNEYNVMEYHTEEQSSRSE